MSIALVLFVSCAGTEDPDGSPPMAADTSDPQPEDTAPPDDTSPPDPVFPPGDFGAFHLWLDVDTGQAGVGAVALEASPDIPNLVECLTDPTYRTTCLPPIPSTVGGFVDVDPNARLDPQQLASVDLGETVGLGPFVLPLVQVPGQRDAEFFAYRGPATFELVADSSIGPSWSGEWPPYATGADLSVSQPVELVSPAAGSLTRLATGDTLPIQWRPAGDGTGLVTLTATSPEGTQRLFRLADDGSHELDVGDLPFTETVQDVDFELTRWERTVISHVGHRIELVAKSSVRFAGRYYDVGTRDPRNPVETCAEADLQPPLPPGDWWWFRDDLPNNNYSTNCSGNRGDAVHRVEVPARSVLLVEHFSSGMRSLVSLSETCPGLTEQCGGAFGSAMVANTAAINLSEQMEERYLYTDSDSIVPMFGFSGVELRVEPIQIPEFFDTCATVPPAAVLQPGYYDSTSTAFAGGLNPGPVGCTGKSAPGAEGLARVVVPAGATLAASIDMPGGDPSLYLLRDCTNVFSCVGGVDATLNTSETLIYANAQAVDQELFLVIDSAAGIQPFFLAYTLN